MRQLDAYNEKFPYSAASPRRGITEIDVVEDREAFHKVPAPKVARDE